MRVRLLALASLASLSAFTLAVFPNNGPDIHFLSVGQYAGASAVAIDPFWVLTARHIDGGNFTTPELGSFTVLEDHASPDADIRLLRVDRAISSYTRILDMGMTDRMVSLVGFGGTGVPSANGWTITGTDGFRHSAVNMVEGIENISFDPSGIPNWDTWYYELDKPGAGNGLYGNNGYILGEGGIYVGDSGGGWFHNLGGNDYLVGINSAIDDALPGGTLTDYFQRGYATQLNNPVYLNWIKSFVPNAVAAVPEPASMAVLGLGALALIRKRRKQA
jgi:hypothetical protein